MTFEVPPYALQDVADFASANGASIKITYLLPQNGEQLLSAITKMLDASL